MFIINSQYFYTFLVHKVVLFGLQLFCFINFTQIGASSLKLYLVVIKNSVNFQERKYKFINLYLIVY